VGHASTRDNRPLPGSHLSARNVVRGICCVVEPLAVRTATGGSDGATDVLCRSATHSVDRVDGISRLRRLPERPA
jgi:hypothetical protein